ncbi:unnamed protein product [Calypogeia fissa]
MSPPWLAPRFGIGANSITKVLKPHPNVSHRGGGEGDSHWPQGEAVRWAGGPETLISVEGARGRGERDDGEGSRSWGGVGLVEGREGQWGGSSPARAQAGGLV